MHSFEFEYLDATGTPHSEREILSTRASGIIRGRFEEHFRYGGFPESTPYEGKREYASSVYQKILLGDIIARNKVRNANALRLLVKKLAESVGSSISFTKLHHVLKSAGASISKDTVIDYESFAEESFLVFPVANHFAKFAERESAPKYYFADNGLLNLFLFRRDAALLENAVATHLHRLYPNDLYFLKSSKTGIDVDFFLPERREAIQVAYSLNDSSCEREIGNLAKLADSLDNAERFIIVTYGDEKILHRGSASIEVVSAFKFLLRQ